MRDLTKKEVEVVSGGWTSSIGDSIEGAFMGLGDGIATGMGIGGTATKTNSILTPITQLAGTIVGGVVGLVWGGVGGLALGKEGITSLMQNYRENFGTSNH